jgi:hypothetical protein
MKSCGVNILGMSEVRWSEFGEMTTHDGILEKGKSWGEVKKLARNRIRWRRFVDSVCP